MKNTENSNIKKALLFGGLSYLGVIITGVFSEGFVRGSLVEANNADVTLRNITENIMLWRWGAASDIFTVAFDIIALFCLYLVLSKADKNLSFLAAVFRIVAITVLAIGLLFHFVPLLIINGSTYLQAFSQNQLAALALLSLKTHNLIYHISLILFAFNNVLIGILMFKSEYFNKFVASVTILFGVSYFANSFTWFIAPDVQKHISGIALKTSFFAELILSLWMIYKGIRMKIIKH